MIPNSGADYFDILDLNTGYSIRIRGILLQTSERDSKSSSRRNRAYILGHSATSVFHWMGANGFTNEQAKRIYDLLMEGYIQWEGSAAQALSDGRSGVYGKSADLSEAKAEEITAVAHGGTLREETAALDEMADINAILDDRNLSETERDQLVKSRRGQGQFRKMLIRLRGGYCCLTGCDTVDLLRASHIKPWRESDNRERLDKFNGLLLTPNADALFDQKLITFTDNGEITVSKKLDKDARRLLLSGCENTIEVFPENRPYLKFHRDRFQANESALP